MAASNPKRKKKRYPNWPVRLILLAIVLSFLISAVLWPVIKFRYSNAFHQQRWEYLTELLLTHSMGWFLTMWVFFFGTCLGSFLNVVAYRIPNGLTILGSSRCPYCMVSIESRHNFPILGWFMLRGRCAACRLPISPRYFIVEIIAGLLLVWLFVFELVNDGRNLPSDHAYKIAALFRKVASGNFKGVEVYDWSLVRIFFIHSIVAYTLLTASLMKLDRLKIPVVWKIVHVAAVWIMIAIWPSDLEFVRTEWQALGETRSAFNRVDIQLMGLLVGMFLGLPFCRLAKDGFSSGILFSMMLIGSCLGIFATLSVGILFLLLAFLCWAVSLLTRRSNFFYQHPLFLIWSAFLIQIACWKWLESQTYWPGSNTSSLLMCAYILLIVATFFVTDRKYGFKKKHVAAADLD